MANIGLRYVVYGALTEDTAAGTFTYATPGKLGPKAIKADLKLNISDTPLYADDGQSERAREFIDGDLTFTPDDIAPEIKSEWLGNTLSTETVNSESVKVLESSADDTPPYFGFGYIVSSIKNGVRQYKARLLCKVQFGEPDDSAETKGQQVNWQTPPIIGKISRRVDTKWKEDVVTTSLATAKAFLNTRLHIS